MRLHCSCRFQPNQVTWSQLWRHQDQCKRYSNEATPFIAHEQMSHLLHTSDHILTLHPLSNPFAMMIEMKSYGDNLRCQRTRQQRLPHSNTAPNNTTRSPSTGEQRHLALESETPDIPPSFPLVLQPTIEPQFAGPHGGRVARLSGRPPITYNHAQSGSLTATAPAPSNNTHALSRKSKGLTA